MKWTVGSLDEKYLIAGFGNGRVVSYVLSSSGTVRPVSKLHVGSSVQCLAMVGNILFVGCADGGIRLVPLGEGAHFDYNPRLWRSVNGSKSPSITSITAVENSGSVEYSSKRKFMCATGGEDGSVNLFSIEEASSPFI
eukprot:CAMPEP_0197827114 /NCGR_PEP_ID=MMETSP1437-20131217/3976_1 /TAXON_ID=49252 ORGANISM="Eucampia antarctica, Strain CCMP1452" /NCGR_SAMPLE_ID=MMETSP1437 /ASSEMBLY_ACC=CAM_ASM_001096 /LENGTH=137 /DNA_ID=CAMNT_0043427847 /DNA_START=140 /DNA_END=553 /DNA_ORIENTATION=-